MRIPADVVEFVKDNGGFLATRDAQNRPTAAEAGVIAIDAETGVAEIAANVRFARRMVDNLRDNGLFALNCTRPWGDHRSMQMKGRCLEIQGPLLIAERLERAISGLRDALTSFGVSQQVADDFGRSPREPQWVLKVQIEEMFDQTPGPGAGRVST